MAAKDPLQSGGVTALHSMLESAKMLGVAAQGEKFVDAVVLTELLMKRPPIGSRFMQRSRRRRRMRLSGLLVVQDSRVEEAGRRW